MAFSAWRSLPDKRRIDPPPESVPSSGRAVLEAGYRDEPDAAIPVDRLLIQSGESLPLILSAGNYRLTLFIQDTEEFILTVE